MRLGRDDGAASPLVVIITFVVIAVLLTVAIYALFFDKPAAGVQLTPVRGADGALSFDVTKESGKLSWDKIQVRFIDRGGRDVATAYLHLPAGAIDSGDRITVSPQPAGGTYILRVLLGDQELSRLAVTV